MKKFGTLLLLLFTLTVSAQSDFDIANEFMSKKGVTLINRSSKTRGESKPYSIFNGEDGKGFAIVANGKVVGYDTENTINEEDLPCCLKELLLKNYSKTAKAAKTRNTYFPDPDWWTPRNVTPIEPLLTTRWRQSYPYNAMLEKKTGICTVIAFVQILHYFRVPQTYKEKVTKDGKPLPITTFNHDLMLDDYEHNYTEAQANEVAKFVYYYWNIDADGFEEYYGMDEHLVISPEDNHYLAADEYLEKGIPFWTCGANHAFVVDGRDSEGRYHVNFGWGSSADGYYAMPNSKEYDFYYNDKDSFLDYVDSALRSFYVIIPKLFPWSYTTDIYKPKFDITNTNNSNVYNLQGVKVGNSLEGLPNGIYIQNGKKIMK